jgi:hypothetical protein
VIFDENFIPKSTGFVLEMKVVYCLESKNASATQNPAREDPYIRAQHQIVNFLRFCETAVRLAKPKRIVLVTNFDNEPEKTRPWQSCFWRTFPYHLRLLHNPNSVLGST